MDKVKWLTNKYRYVENYKIPCAEKLQRQDNQVAGIRCDNKVKRFIKMIIWPFFELKNFLFCDGFIEHCIGRWIRELSKDNKIYLEIGCGDMSLIRYLPDNICYNAFDLSLSEFHLRRVLSKKRNVNIALASATDIPLEPNSASLLVSTECFEHIPNIENAIKEIHRIAKPHAMLVCSIPNNYCYKYQKKGPHPEHINNWTYEGFIKFMISHKFKLLKSCMKGFWIPLPLWLTMTSYQLPISLKKEFYNTNFFYMFEVIK